MTGLNKAISYNWLGPGCSGLGWTLEEKYPYKFGFRDWYDEHDDECGWEKMEFQGGGSLEQYDRVHEVLGGFYYNGDVIPTSHTKRQNCDCAKFPRESTYERKNSNPKCPEQSEPQGCNRKVFNQNCQADTQSVVEASVMLGSMWIPPNLTQLHWKN